MHTGIQVSSLRPLLHTGSQVREAFARFAQMGCRYLQLQWIDPAVPPAAVADALREAGLTAVSVQEKFQDFVKAEAYHLALMRACGCGDLCLSGVPAAWRSAEGIPQLAGLLAGYARRLAAEGRTLSLHFVGDDLLPAAAGGPPPAVQLWQALEAQAPGAADLCLDLYHLARAGIRPADGIRRCAGRVTMLHFKDYRLCADGSLQLAPAGQGQVDFGGCAGAALAAGVRYAFVEQETWQGDPFVCLQQALQWLNGQLEAAQSPGGPA